ncbi:MAG TPA: UDP-N-acetylglucosamine--N-acetylmuramyl-(pentapeptide) pyrophosphoryl-undecaprenol N-acetylglucosamine transferase [Campylobacterales bacterium]|nr:UDP-N-acetylglucosamine--N-acetylmuramyl-(pentapeptide) pyrophosphoryl-undecaprenol N-acetylglucosamine transferase [Campylobacterales bacterium]
MNVAITGGGTGGHLTIAKAIEEELIRQGDTPIFIGSQNGQDRSWFEDDNKFEEKYFFNTGGVVNKGLWGKIKSLFNIFLYSIKCRDIFKNHKIDIVFSVGGYSAAPASFASIMLKKSLYIHEQNAIMGRLNKTLKPYCDGIFSSYDSDALIKDYPVRDIFFQNARVRDSIKTIIFLGGSQGANAINNFAKKIAPTLKKNSIKIIHQCGKNDFEALAEFYKENKITVDLFAFSKNLEDKIKEADFAISRSGASTMWELCASMIPALYIPYPYAAADHQYHNAVFLKEQNLAFLKRESELDSGLIDEILKSDISKISLGLNNIISQGGAKKIVDFIKNRQSSILK